MIMSMMMISIFSPCMTKRLRWCAFLEHGTLANFSSGYNRDKWKKCIGDKDEEARLQVNKTQIPNVIAKTHDTA
ncbi:unnamed protein product [Camellia sinensis]